VNPLQSFFEDVPDPRQEELIDHPFINILSIVLLAQFCGVEGWDDMYLWSTVRREWLGTFLDLSKGLPSSDTLRRTMAALLPGPFRKAFLAYARDIAGRTQGKLVAIDGKAMRGSARPTEDVPALHVVRAWVVQNGLVLGQLATDAKSNEITAVPELLELLSLKGALVTLDAMGTQVANAEKILEKEADYVMAVKDNQPTLAAEVRAALEPRPRPERKEGSYHATSEAGHGRCEQRRVWVEKSLEGLPTCQQWPGAKTIIRVESVRETVDGGSTENRYYISSRSLTAKQAANAIRRHWSIENQCHWQLDVAFGEDDQRVWQGHAPENLSQIRSLVMLALKRDTSRKLSMKQKLKLCAWDQAYLIHVLQGISTL
jgi:predicted transposase YbfD/YdcC